MTEFGKIDDPVDASFEAWPEESPNFGEKLGGLALTFATFEFPPAKIAQILKDQFFPPNRFGRIEYLLNAVRIQLKILETQNTEARERVTLIEQKLDAPAFSEAVAAACEEAARATNEKKIQHLAAVVVGTLTANQWADPGEEIPALIRDIAQLAEKDLKALSMLRTVHAAAIATAPNLFEPDAFSRETAALMRDVNLSGFHPDDFLSTCERLRGFGLAVEVLRNTSHMAPHDFCYRPTRRGLAILEYLAAVPEPAAEAK